MAAIVNLKSGADKPLEEVTIHEYVVQFKGIAAAGLLYPIMSASIRVSIIFFYIRMFCKGHGVAMRYILWGLLVLQGVYIIVFSIALAFVCRPLHYSEELLKDLGNCDFEFYNHTTTALYSVSLAFDVLILVFPIFPVSKLHLPVIKRIGIGAIFVFGAAYVDISNPISLCEANNNL